MIRVITGHLACGRWRLKQEDGIFFMAHPQPFSRRNEFRLGSDQIIGVEVEEEEPKQTLVKILFKDDRYCRAYIDPSELAGIESMVSDTQAPPLAKNQTQAWINGVFAFFILCILFELFK
jgi:hypothetical protein